VKCRRRSDGCTDGAAIVSALVGKFRSRKHILGINDEQEIVVRLQVDVPGARRGGNVIYRLQVPRIAHVDDAKALREHVPDIGVALSDHDLHAVRAAALIGIAE
jgi:hypothetical protein